jgi:putative lipoic acid-binding regulatory protein
MSEDQETLLQFPCEFPIKVFGKADCNLDAVVFSLIYHSVTVVITAQSKAQLDAIYRSLTASEHVLMAL